MKFIDALYKYEEITRNDKEIFYQHDGRVYMKTEGLDEIGVIVSLRDLEDLFEHTDWYEYIECEYATRVPKGQIYYYVAPALNIASVTDDRFDCDTELYESHNYFRNKEDAQHLANTFKRLSLIINTKRYDTERDINSIIQEIDREYPRLKRDIDDYNREYIL